MHTLGGGLETVADNQTQTSIQRHLSQRKIPCGLCLKKFQICFLKQNVKYEYIVTYFVNAHCIGFAIFSVNTLVGFH